MKRWLAALLLTAVAERGAAAGADMNAPLVQSAPTLGSEVHRGADAADACRRVDVVTDLQGYEDCIDAAHDRNRQAMGTAYEAFDAGLYYKERRTLQILLGIEAKNPIMDGALLGAAFNLADARYQSARDRIGATDEQVMLASVG